MLAYQGADQLRQFNAMYLTVNLVGISVLREMGILLTAIVIAGRSGSAFTAQIGTMQVSEEVDALRTMGLDPMEVLAIPRVAALIVTLPILTFFADVMGLLGGGVMYVILANETFGQYVGRLNDVVTATEFWVGMVKAPVFAMLDCAGRLFRRPARQRQRGERRADDHPLGRGGHLPGHHFRRLVLHPVRNPEHLRCPSAAPT